MRRSQSQRAPLRSGVPLSPPMRTVTPVIYPLPSMPTAHTQAKKSSATSPLPPLMSNVRPVFSRVRRTTSNVGEYRNRTIVNVI